MSKIFDDIKLQYKIGDITNKIIYWNVGLFLLSLVLFFKFSAFRFEYPYWLSLSSNPNDFLIFPWTFLTYAFLHSGFWHLFFNMVMLNFSGRLFLTFFTQKQFLGLYILSAIFAGLAFAIAYLLMGISAPIVGASAAVLSILVATTAYQPLMQIRLLLIGNVKLWHLTAVILILDIMQILIENTGGHISHIAGAIFGVIYIKVLQSGTDLSNIVTNIINFFVNLFQPSKSNPFKKVHVNPKKTTVNAQSKIVVKDKTQQQIDEILDKISQSGYDSLTAQEKEFLFKAGK
ncbi:rhomboid family protein [Flavobacterium aquatile]|uniref:Transmembrane rhomboid family protein n=1 Tax=Flavobacterium aquatile LMG 4008 = ATCC 11947 TaxID=1453498 RepID=A0A095SUI1_9FLAO|nr:rhomboid family intramembrane serine protease [Flavobacterium aquatile]KGD68321.1 transmembrane rhomboid family protein [Flavobacterium aquatile LMG 4008 = ATCC 11947]OXA68746.1 rhomboid family intramembrane serine protease [Flavobacterium aquatile LMG 4008 = ATCC 11947]GEC77198.1 rhomboid family intramembrane serine protease [Flavobacterium aquatile]